MGTKAEKDRQKQIQDKCQNLLTQMLRDDDNKYCVDCDAKGPRWASWNLGIFLCIRCAGIHRNLGVHISKVKSVNLDAWTPEQVVSLQQMGNSRARAVYEANLPDSFRRPQSDSALEGFIRAKYEAKKYIAREWVPPGLPKVNWDRELDEEEKARRRKREPKTPAAPVTAVRKLENVIPQPLPKPSTSPKTPRSNNPPSGSSRPKPHQQTTSPAVPAVGNPPAPGTASTTTAAADLLGLDTPVDETGSKDEELFTNFLSAPAVATTTTAAVSGPGQGARTEEEESFFNQPTSAVQQASAKMTTDSILALYAKAPPQAPYAANVGTSSGFIPAGANPSLGMAQQTASVPQQQQMFQQTPFCAIQNGMPNPAAIPQGAGIPPHQGMFIPGAPAGMNLASNPFYSLHQQSTTFQAQRVTQDLRGLSLGAVPAASLAPGQGLFASGFAAPQAGTGPTAQTTLSNNLWQ